jgi:hypothetical protein
MMQIAHLCVDYLRALSAPTTSPAHHRSSLHPYQRLALRVNDVLAEPLIIRQALRGHHHLRDPFQGDRSSNLTHGVQAQPA